MKLFIPEIGTELELTKDWEFKLVLEHRNNKLIERFYNGYIINYSYFNYVVQELGYNGSVLRTKSLQDKIDKLSWKDGMSTGERIKFKKELNDLWHTNRLEWIPEENLEPTCLPKGTKLKVDRIYIRKGKGMSDYSSLTFYAQLPGEKKKIRFFAHLTDVNTIECNIL